MNGPAPRVLVLIKGLGIGGAEKLISEGAAFWDRERFDYRVAYVLPWKDQLVPDLLAHDVPTDCLGGARGSAALATVRLHRLVREWGPDLIHAHLPLTGIMARTTRRPLVYTEHNLADSYRQPTRSLNRATYRRNDAVLAVSQPVADSIARFPGPNAQVIPNGVTVDVGPEGAATARAELGVAPDAPLVVHVGNIRPHKGHSTLIEAAAVLQRLRPDVTIVSIGGEKHDGDLERLRGAVAAHGDLPLRFLGRRPDALAFVAAADIYVNPADVEGLPVSILEALALARPVVATAVGGVPAIVRSDETGVLVPPKDPEALAREVVRLLEQRDFAARLGQGGKQLIEREYSLEAMVRSVEKVYEQVLSG